MITKCEMAKSQRLWTIPLKKETEYCVSGSGVFTVEVLHQGREVYGLILREDYVQLPKFKEDCQLRLIGRDTMTFTIYVSDDRLF